MGKVEFYDDKDGQQHPLASKVRRCLATWMIGFLGLTNYPVFAETPSAAEAGKKLSDPLSDIWALFTEINHTWSEGDFSGGKWRSGQAVIFQPIMPFKLTENYKLITRPTLPMIPAADIPDGRRFNSVDLPGGTGVLVTPAGEATFSDKSGLGDMQLPLRSLSFVKKTMARTGTSG